MEINEMQEDFLKQQNELRDRITVEDSLILQQRYTK